MNFVWGPWMPRPIRLPPRLDCCVGSSGLPVLVAAGADPEHGDRAARGHQKPYRLNGTRSSERLPVTSNATIRILYVRPARSRLIGIRSCSATDRGTSSV